MHGKWAYLRFGVLSEALPERTAGALESDLHLRLEVVQRACEIGQHALLSL